MSIATVVTRGYSTGNVNLVVTRGYSIGDAAPVVTPVVTQPSISGGGAYRYFTPDLTPRKRKAIDKVIRQEARLRDQIAKYEDSGADIQVLSDLLERLREIQITLLRLALESAAAQTYVGIKRMLEEDQEVEDISYILSQLDE